MSVLHDHRAGIRHVVAVLGLAIASVAVVALERRGYGLGADLWSAGRYGGVRLVAALGAAWVSWQAWRARREAPAGAWALLVLGTALLVLAHLDNRRNLGGDEIFEISTAGIVLAGMLRWIAGTGRTGRRFLGAATVLVVAYLSASGAWMDLRPPLLPRLDLGNTHGLVGFYAAPVLAAYVLLHMLERDREGPSHGQRIGFATAVSWIVAIVTGIEQMTAPGGRYVFAQPWVHRASCWLALVLTLVHVGRAFLRGTDRGFEAHVRRSVRLAAGALVVALGLALAAADRWGGGSSRWSRFRPPAAVLAVPGHGVVAASTDGPGLPRDVLQATRGRPGCGRLVACHHSEVATWGRSAHRFSADPAYRRVVRTLTAEQGPEAVRLCAVCHDPVPLFAGELVAGRATPPSEGVTCMICHSSRDLPAGMPVGNGVYRLEPPLLLTALLGPPATQGMMVYARMDLHRRAVSDRHLRDDTMCGACHQLTLNDVPLRRQLDEFRAAGLHTVDGKPQTCRSCHLPVRNQDVTDERRPRDHRFLGANIALAPLVGETLEARVAFIADALSLDVVRLDPGQVRVTLANRRDGHGFPSGPLDLLQYWFEVQVAGGRWVRAGMVNLFDETLRDASGNALRAHEVWRVHEVSGGERIPVGGTRSWVLTLPAEVRDRPAITVRLQHARFPSAWAEALAAEGMFTGTVEILRASSGAPDRAAAVR